ncbi:flagellar biosynthetic protein FliR [Psychromonas antarctica]|jgi:flagellar biosynthetic protein FliR|uniref:flagellar biosynthetic protein FliR n=1 Tax=Psychromonas antarctica TaxID=67573 RepID=UPI001EE956B8|nr:flagellar biosynthetic protein FliR [Psychromonas antarctica]MCG6199833.1 flagellar type III secretion system protein FliR [Psychromonas antarctica]
MTFSADLLLDWLANYLWAFCRIAAMLMVMVAIGSRTTPTRIRLFYALTITLAVLPVLPSAPIDIELFSLASAFVILQQILIGIAIGTISVFVVQTFVVAGQVIAMQTSLGFASMADPMNGQSSPVVGQFYVLLVTLLFLTADGHLLMIEMIVRSFDTLPISMEGLLATDYEKLAGWFSLMFSAALAFSIASMVAMLLVNLSFGIMTKAAPQLNIFSLGFSISMVFGLFVLWITMVNVPIHFENQWLRGINLMCELLNNPCEKP